MGLVENNVALYTTIMKRSDTLDGYYQVSKAHVDTIKAHGGNPGYHWALAQEHLDVYMLNKGFNTPDNKTP